MLSPSLRKFRHVISTHLNKSRCVQRHERSIACLLQLVQLHTSYDKVQFHASYNNYMPPMPLTPNLLPQRCYMLYNLDIYLVLYLEAERTNYVLPFPKWIQFILSTLATNKSCMIDNVNLVSNIFNSTK